ncbi:MAG: hypothetical protein EBX68_04090 [Betaproteobacteria bacterium]|nr:hypothetical protein [Betaproteobacteria bacterium]
MVVTFDPHPDSVVHPERASGLLIPPAERIRLMAECGIDAVFSVAFNHDVQAMSAATPITSGLTLKAWLQLFCRDFAAGNGFRPPPK